MLEKPEDIFVGIVAQKAIITDKDKVLLVRDTGTKMWDLPGGRLHKNEQPREGLKRELSEELGCECELGRVIFTGQFYHARADSSSYFIAYEAFLSKHAIITISQDEISEFIWLPKNEISSEILWENCTLAIEEYFKINL